VIESDLHWMERAVELAREAAAHEEVPVGAVVVLDGEIIGEGWNRPIAASDIPPQHQEFAVHATTEYFMGRRRRSPKGWW